MVRTGCKDLLHFAYEVSQTADSLRFKGRYFISENPLDPLDTICFTVILSKDPEKHFVLQFNGARSRYLAKKYYLRGYLENEITDSIYGLSSFSAFILNLAPGNLE